MHKTRKIGRGAESKVCDHLSSLGFSLLDKNWTCRWGELDVVAKKRDLIAFVEVKYRRDCETDVERLINYRKRQAMSRAIRYYLYSNRIAYSDYKLKCYLFFVSPTYLYCYTLPLLQ